MKMPFDVGPGAEAGTVLFIGAYSAASDIGLFGCWVQLA